MSEDDTDIEEFFGRNIARLRHYHNVLTNQEVQKLRFLENVYNFSKEWNQTADKTELRDTIRHFMKQEHLIQFEP
jgi:hypothetical protein